MYDEDWSKRPDDEVFKKPSEDPGSRASHWRDVEIRRRMYIVEKENLDLRQKLLNATIDNADEQKQAVAEMAKQSRYMFWSVIAAFLAAFFTLIAALIAR